MKKEEEEDTRMPDLERMLDLNCKWKEHQTISFFQLAFKFQKFSEHVRNVIQWH